MKRKIAAVVAATLCTSFVCAAPLVLAEEKQQTAYMYIDENEVVKSIESTMYGINYEWGGTETESILLKKGTTEINPEYIKAFDGCLPQGRTAGMSANRLFWKGAIGDMEDRTLQKFWSNSPRKQTFGPVEWFTANLTVDPNTSFIYTVNLYDTQENIADLVEFLRGDGTVNYNGGVNWAQKRIELGLEEPINIMAFELANEIDAGSEGAWNSDRYVAACRRTIRTIRSVDPDAKIAVMRMTGGTAQTFPEWHRKLLRELGDEIDYIAAHHYPGFKYVVDIITSNVGVIAKDIKTITGDDRIKIMLTECSMYPDDMNTWGTPGYRSPHTMKGVLTTAEFYLRASYFTPIATSSYHALNSANWAVVYEYNGKVERTAIGDLIRMSARNFVGDNLKVEQSQFVYNEPDNEKPENLAGAAIRTEDGINLFLMNQHGTKGTFQFEFSDGKYKAVKMSQISGPDLYSDKYQQYQEITYIEDQEIDTGLLTSYTVPPYSVTVLNLVPCEDENAVDYKIDRIKSFSANTDKAIIDGEVQVFESSPIVEDGRIYLPANTLESILDAGFVLSPDLKQCTLTVGTDEYVFVFGSDKYYKNGVEVTTVAPAIYKDNCTYIPLKTIAEEIGYSTYWDQRGFAVLHHKAFPELNANDDNLLLDSISNVLFSKGGNE